MAIPLPDRDRLPPGPRRDFVEALHHLYDSAGQPAARQISRAIFKTTELESVSHETVSSTLKGGSLPTWLKVHAIVTVLSRQAIPARDTTLMLRDFHALWIKARRGASDAAPEPAEAPRATIPAVPPPPEPPAALVGDPQPRVDRLVSGMPERSARFTGRGPLLDAMRAKHEAHPEAPLVLYGLGGVGKTQLALEYVTRFGGAYDLVWWVPADRAERARAALVGLADRLGVPQRANADQTVTAVLNRLESRELSFLLVYDGVEDDDIRGLIPAIGGNVIVTGRDPGLARDSTNEPLEVPDFDSDEAVDFLSRRHPDIDDELARNLTLRLGRLPLALEQVSALRHATRMAWADLVSRLDEPDGGLFADGAEPAYYPHTVSASLRLGLEQLRAASPFAAQVFELFAWFGAEPVARALLRQGGNGDVTRPLKRVLQQPIELAKAMATISRYGLARLHTADQRIEVQPLMRLALRDLLGEEGRERALRNVQAILTEAGRGWPDGLGHWDMHRAVAAHVLPARLISSAHLATVRVVHNQIRYRYLMKDFEDARRLGEAAVTAWRARPDLGPDHELVLLASREWANALRSLGRYEQAREITADAMRRMRDDHPYAREITRSHAADLRIAGEYRAALELDRATYASYRQEFTDEHDRTVGGRHNLAVCLRLLGEFGEAEQIDRAEVRYQRERDGDAHRRTLRTLLAVNALAEDLFGLGRFAEAVEVQADAYEASRSALGPGDEAVLLARRMIALCHRRLGDAGTAAEELEATYRVCAGFWGADHEFTLAAAMSCANALLAARREGEAYALAVDAVGAYERVFGESNPLTRAAQLNLAVILRAVGDRGGARRLDTTALDGMRATVGERHPFGVVAMTNLASDLAHDGDHAGAYTLSLQAWRTAVEIRGADHLDTLVAAANLVVDRAAAGKTDEGPDHDAVLDALRRTAGPDHPLVGAVADRQRVDGDVEPPST